MNEDRMRELYARSSARRAASDPPCEVSLEAMVDVLERRGSEEERRRVLAEILRSPACREEFELLRAVVRASQPVRAPVVVPQIWRWAAGIAAVAGLGLAFAVWRGRSPEPLRGGAPAIVLHGPADGAQVAAVPAFAWSPVPGALEYRLELLTDGGQVAFSSTVRDTTLALSPAPALPAGRYLWLVVAETPTGESARSETRRLIIEGQR
jgi:hypothetical protein